LAPWNIQFEIGRAIWLFGHGSHRHSIRLDCTSSLAAHTEQSCND
jgi:hypothetical protein